MLEILNQIPALTWNKLKVNESETKLFKLKSKIDNFKNVKKDISGSIQIMKSADSKEAKIETAVGEIFTDFVKKNNNEINYLVVEKDDENKVIFEYNLDEKNPILIDYNDIIVKKNTNVLIIQKYFSDLNFKGKHAGHTNIYLEENANLQLIQVQFLNKDTQHFSNISIRLNKNAKASVVRAEMGANSVVAGCCAELIDKNAEFSIDSVYYGDSNRILDFNDIARHIGEKTNSIINAKGALFDNCKKIYRGTIDFKRGSKKSIGDESENTLVFSNNAVNKSAPLILCQEDDVEGHHAASIGRIDEGLMFYMQTRGFDKDVIRQMMIEGSFSSIISKIPDEDLRQKISRCIAKRRYNDSCQHSDVRTSNLNN